MAARNLWGCGRIAVADPNRPPPENFTVTNNAEAVEDHAAVVEDEKAEPGTVETGPPQGNVTVTNNAADRIYDLEYFQNFGDFNCSWKGHNAALKWFRDSSEGAGGTERIFSNTHPV